MNDFHALSLLGVSSEQLTASIKQLSSLPHIGEQRIRLVVDPTRITQAAQLVEKGSLPAVIVAVAGYPTGRHHTLIKASEARLAVESGAEEVWVSVDDTIEDSNTILSELITLNEACPDPVKLGLIAPENNSAAQTAATYAARQAGFAFIVAREVTEAIEKAADGLPLHIVDL
ncbi:deoxyribose-phosphate aldolase [Corynebacterium sp. L4756]|uniref:deoxyribose-phosphate aldolase n=1 Tax=unclassified Corynebacterium TaxID=2624378 RepID=UPI00374CA012